MQCLPLYLSTQEEFCFPQLNVPLFTSLPRKTSASNNALSPSLTINPVRALLSPIKYPPLYLSTQEELSFPKLNVPLFTFEPRKTSASPNAMSSSLPLNPGGALLPPNGMSPSLPLNPGRPQLYFSQCNVSLFTSQPRKSSASTNAMSPCLPPSPNQGMAQLPPMRCPPLNPQEELCFP